MGVRLFVGNLPFGVTEAEVREHFSGAGVVTSVFLPTDRETGKPRGFAFVEFDSQAEADEAVRRFNNQMLGGRPIAVNEARARDSRPRSAPPSRTSAGDHSPGGARPPGTSSYEAMPVSTEPPQPRRLNKAKSPLRPERVRKGPLREIVRGQFFGGGDEDDSFDDESGENFASRIPDSDGDDGS